MKVHLGKYRKDGTRIQKVKIDLWDTWSMDNDLAKIIYPALVKFRENQAACPPDLNPEEWDNALDDMIESFRKYATGDIVKDFVANDPKKTRWNIEETQRGLALFAKYYRYLWY